MSEIENTTDVNTDDVMVGEDEQMVDAEVKAPRVRRQFFGHHNVANDISKSAAVAFFKNEVLPVIGVEGGAKMAHLRGRRSQKTGGDYLIASITPGNEGKINVLWSAGKSGSPLTSVKQTEELTAAQAAQSLATALVLHGTSDKIQYNGAQTRTYVVLHLPKQKVEVEVEGSAEETTDQ